MRLRDYLTAAGLAVSLSLTPACDKGKSKPDDVECSKKACRDLYREQDNGLKVPNCYRDKLVDKLEGRLGSESLKVETYNFAGDKQPDVLLVTVESGEGESKKSKAVLYFASKLDGKITESFIDDIKAENGRSQADGYWDYRIFPGDGEKNLTIKEYFEAAKIMVDVMNSKKVIDNETI